MQSLLAFCLQVNQAPNVGITTCNVERINCARGGPVARPFPFLPQSLPLRFQVPFQNRLLGVQRGVSAPRTLETSHQLLKAPTASICRAHVPGPRPAPLASCHPSGRDPHQRGSTPAMGRKHELNLGSFSSSCRSATKELQCWTLLANKEQGPNMGMAYPIPLRLPPRGGS